MEEFAGDYLHQVVMNRIVRRQADQEIWVKHYSSNHQILLVGEGDFSFALSLALAFGSASNIVASSLDSYDVVIKKYKRAKNILELLASLGAQLLHGVDVTMMKSHTDLQMRKFDRIVYNFPHAGFLGIESDPQVIKIHKRLVHGFFKNASGMLHSDGEIHISHKTSHPFYCWDIEELASQNSLALLEQVEFKLEDYPGYQNKRGAGSRSDHPFPLGESSTFKFVLSPTATKPTSNPKILQESMLPRTNVNHHSFIKKECFRIFSEYFSHARSMNGYPEYLLFYSVTDTLRLGFERYKDENRGRPLNGYITLLEELRNLSKQRIVYLQNRLLEIDLQHGL